MSTAFVVSQSPGRKAPRPVTAAIKSLAALAAILCSTSGAVANTVFITEFMSDTGNNEKFEYVEFTNVGSTPVDMTGWSEDDSHAMPNQTGHSLSGLGTLAPGESGILTEATPASFRAYWGLTNSVKVVGNYTNDNLSTTSDSITLFNNHSILVDRLDYSTANGGSGDTIARNAPFSALGLNNNSLWQNSFVGDAFLSFDASTKPSIVGSPGLYPLPVPEPTSLALLAVACIGLGAMAMGRRAAVFG